MLTIRPLAFFTRGKNVIVTSIVPRRLVSTTRLYMAVSISSMGSISTIPALFTNPQRPKETKLKCYSLYCMYTTVRGNIWSQSDIQRTAAAAI